MDKNVLDSDILTLAEVADYLKVSEKTIMRMVKREEIPVIRIAGQWRFLRSAIQDWLLARTRYPQGRVLANMVEAGELAPPVSRMLHADWIQMDLPQGDKQAVFWHILKPLVDRGLINDPDRLMQLLIERERLASTGLGGGIAIPHVRKPEGCPVSQPLLAIGISRTGIEFQSLDGKPVHVVFLLLTHLESVHLKSLSAISRIVRQEGWLERVLLCRTADEVFAHFVQYDYPVMGDR
jgi:PTS system nitrogen regulatory IIA component